MLMAFGVMLSFAMSGCSTTADQTAGNEGSRPGLRSENAQEQRDIQERIQQQNMEERRRLEGTTKREPSSTEVPPYTENQPIGGQQSAGAADFPQPAFPFVKGVLMQIEGEYYTLQDAEGKNVRVHVDKATKMDGTFHIGDVVEVQRTLPGHAIALRRASSPLNTGSSAMGSDRDRLIQDSQVSLGGAKQTVRGEVLQLDGDKLLVKDGHGNEVRFAVNKNTRMFCAGDQSSVSSLQPIPSASDNPNAKGPQDLSLTAEQQGSQVGPGTRSSGIADSGGRPCKFNKGELIEAEVSDMGVATFIKPAGRRQPGQALP
jgi:hypothetical protein